MMRALAAAALLAAIAPAQAGPRANDAVGFDQRVGAAVPVTLPFVDAHGARLTLADASRGRPLVLVLGYLACRDLCPVTLPGVAEALRAAGLHAGSDYGAAFVDVDPREDANLRATGAWRLPEGDRAAWSFVGGDAASIRAVAESVGFRYRPEDGGEGFAHAAGFVVLTPSGRISRYFFGVRYDAGDVRRAVDAAARGEDGGVVQRLRLLCSHFDPATGRYSAAILDAFRGLVVGCALAGVLLAWRRHRRDRTLA